MLVKAYAKVNLVLHVLAKRKDGFHEIDTIMTRVDLADEVWLEPAEKIALEVINSDLPNDKSNLAFQAALVYMQAAAIKQGVHITLKKNIPVAAGLGGGSADAAAVLKGLKQLYPSEVNMRALAERLGSDVPFFLENVLAARARGRGEKLTIINLPKLHFVLINPNIAISAKEAYDNLQGFSIANTALNLDNCLKNPKVLPELHNDLQAGVLKLYPKIRSVLEVLRKADLNKVLMSGSGSTCFAIVEDAQYAKGIATQIKIQQPRWWVTTTETI